MFAIDDDPFEGFMSVNEAAAQMGRTPQEVRALARRGVLRSSTEWGWLLVRPAILSGAADA